MIPTLITAVSGFVAGLWYAKGKPEPLKSALKDTKRACRSGMAIARKAYKWVKEAAAEQEGDI